MKPNLGIKYRIQICSNLANGTEPTLSRAVPELSNKRLSFVNHITSYQHIAAYRKPIEYWKLIHIGTKLKLITYITIIYYNRISPTNKASTQHIYRWPVPKKTLRACFRQPLVSSWANSFLRFFALRTGPGKTCGYIVGKMLYSWYTLYIVVG